MEDKNLEYQRRQFFIPPKPEAKIMNKKEFGSWLTNKEKR